MTLTRSFLVVSAVALSVLSYPAIASDQSHGSGHGTKNHEGNAGHSDHNVIKVGDLEVSHGWARATVKTAKVGGGYLVIKNKGDAPDRLISGGAAFAARVEVHEMKIVDDVMRMRPLSDGLVIPAGAQVVLKPGAEHIMFMGLKKQLVEGEKVSVTLDFENAGSIEMPFYVNGLAAKNVHDGHHKKAGKAEHSGHDHGDNHSSHNH